MESSTDSIYIIHEFIPTKPGLSVPQQRNFIWAVATNTRRPRLRTTCNVPPLASSQLGLALDFQGLSIYGAGLLVILYDLFQISVDRGNYLDRLVSGHCPFHPAVLLLDAGR
jgi:hypothetical protein